MAIIPFPLFSPLSLSPLQLSAVKQKITPKSTIVKGNPQKTTWV